MRTFQENSINIVSVYLCAQRPYVIKDTIADNHFTLAAGLINCRRGKIFTNLNDAKKYLNNQGLAYVLYEITLPVNFLINNNERINSEYEIKSGNIKNLILSSYWYKDGLTLTANKDYFYKKSHDIDESKNESGKHSNEDLIKSANKINPSF